LEALNRAENSRGRQPILSRRGFIRRLTSAGGLGFGLLSVAVVTRPIGLVASGTNSPPRTFAERRIVEGWTVHVSGQLLAAEPAATARALELLREQLREIIRVVPGRAVTELQRVALWFSPEYPGVPPRAEYHPGADWLRANRRDPAMVRGVEFTDIKDFEAETRRMPNFTLHELAHAYHDRVLAGGFDNPEIRAAFDRAKVGGKYDRVQRQDAKGNLAWDRAYALTNPMEYFAETTEAFFSRNDFYPFNRAELRQADPEMEELLGKLWGVSP
jgi:hypothetical protein